MGANVQLHDLATLTLEKERLVPIQYIDLEGPRAVWMPKRIKIFLVLLNINYIINAYIRATLKRNMQSVLY
jgi:hypothetical protein